LVRVCAVGGHVHQQRSRSAIVQEVLGHAAGASAVGGGQATVKVRQEVDLGAVVHAGGEDTGHFDADVGLGVVADDGGVDEECQERVLVLGGVLLEEGGGVVVADGGVGWALGDGGADKGEGGEGELHHVWLCLSLHN